MSDAVGVSWSPLSHQHAAQVIGNDVDEAMREQAARGCAGLLNVTIAGGDWTDGEEAFDLVTMVAVLHHLDVAETLREVRRRLTLVGVVEGRRRRIRNVESVDVGGSVESPQRARPDSTNCELDTTI